MTVEEKISTLVERYCRNRSHLADLIGISPQAVGNWIYRDRIPERGIDAILARFPQIDRNWLRGGNNPALAGPMPLPDEEDETEPPAYPSPATYGNAYQQTTSRGSAYQQTASRGSAYQQTASRGNAYQQTTSHGGAYQQTTSRGGAMLVEGIEPTLGDAEQPETREGLVPLQMPRRDVRYVFRCHGHSMMPRIQDGDYVGVGDALGRYEAFRSGEPYLVQTNDGRLMVKMVQDPGPDSPYLILTTENASYQLADGGRLAKTDFRAAYRVIMVMRDI